MHVGRVFLYKKQEKIMNDSWESWIQNVGGGLIKTVAEAKYKAPIELQKMQLQAYSNYGVPYMEGQANGMQPITAGIPQSWLLIGAVILAVVLVKN